MKSVAFLCLSILIVSWDNSYAQAWPNEPSGSTVLIDCPFSGSLCPGMWDAYKSASFTSIQGAPVSPSMVFDDYLAAGSTTGSGQWGVVLPNAKELYVGTWWSTNADFQGLCNNTNKMLFARNPDIDNNFLVWQGAPGQPKTFKWYMQAGYDNCGHPGEYGMCYSRGDGTGWFEPNVGNGTVAAGTGWHLIEFYLRTSTTKTSRDGAVRWWIDGRPVGSYNSVNLTPGGLSDFQINHTWDGTNCLLPPQRDLSKAWHHYWDHLRISIPHGAPIPILPLAITSTLQTSAQVGKAYSVTLGAENGKAPYAWTISAGSIPPGLTLNKTTGVLSGVPTTIGRSDFTIKVMDSSVPAAETTKAFSIIVSRSTGIEGREKLTVNGLQLTAESRMGSVRFHLPQPGAYVLSAYDLAGKKVYEHKASTSGNKQMQIQTPLKNGIYLAKFVQGKMTSTVRFNVMN